MDADDLIALARRIAPDLGVAALFLAGSHGAGTADRWSDVDLVGVCPAEARAAAMARWRAVLAEADTLVHWTVGLGGRLSNAITESYLRTDLYLVDTLDGRARYGLRPLHDPEGLWLGLAERAAPTAPDPERAAGLAAEFLRILGLTPVALHRGEIVLMVRGAGMLRDLIMDMMLERHGHRGGMLHPSRVLTAEEMAALAALPAPVAARDSVVAAHAALARAGLPVARDLCALAGADWPAALEDAVRAHLAGAGIRV